MVAKDYMATLRKVTGLSTCRSWAGLHLSVSVNAAKFGLMRAQIRADLIHQASRFKMGRGGFYE